MLTLTELERLLRAFERVMLATGYEETCRLLEEAEELEKRVLAD